MISERVQVDPGDLKNFCDNNRIHRLSIFGSALTEKFTDNSDIDVLVEFERGHRVGLLGMAAMERDLSRLFGNRTIDLRTPQELSPYFRDEVLKTAALKYVS